MKIAQSEFKGTKEERLCENSIKSEVKVNISKVYPLAQVAEAHRESETWHVRGKLVLEIKKENS